MKQIGEKAQLILVHPLQQPDRKKLQTVSVRHMVLQVGCIKNLRTSCDLTGHRIMLHDTMMGLDVN